MELNQRPLVLLLFPLIIIYVVACVVDGCHGAKLQHELRT